MGLTPEQIKKLLEAPAPKKRGSKKKGPDTNVRDTQTWFKLAPQAIDENTTENLKCDNPNCVDTRPPRITATGVEVKIQFCVRIKDQLCCRPCFLAGWLLDDPEQQQLQEAS